MNEIDLSKLHAIANGDARFVQDMLEIYLDTLGQEVGHLKGAVRLSDIPAIHHAVHKLVPPTRHLGFEKAVQALEEFEKHAETGQPLADEWERLQQMLQRVGEMVRAATE